jgi:uncharacterized MAPEG superfamily protein
MSIELTLLGWSTALLMVHILVQAALTVPLRGLAWAAGPRDDGPAAPGRYPGRAQRALENFKETYPAFIALALGLVVAGKTGGLGAAGAELWLAARVVYLPIYLLGLPWLRPLVYVASAGGLILMLVRLL